MKDLISVIVPIYGIERYIGICVESLIKQTYENLEIILVDDGSFDRCPDICDLYAKKDSRIKVVHKKNGGLVSARKAGLATATGKYVGYVDGDDWVEPGFYKSLHDAITEHDSDLVIAGQCRDLFNTGSHIKNNIPAGYYCDEDLKHLQQNMLSYGDFYRIGVTTYVWNKLFRRDLLLKHQNEVDNQISIGEDAAVVYPYIMECKRVQITDNCEYHYRQREDSMLKQSKSFSQEAVGLKLLYSHLSAFAASYPDEYNLKQQVDDFVLGISIMRSGGVLKEIQEEYSPYPRDFYGKNIVIWSAGTFGQQLMNRIKENNYCNVVGWIDVDYWEYRRCCLDVDPIEAIDNMSYDFILLATVNEIAAEKVKASLVNRGVDPHKVFAVSCPKEIRAHLLQRYLEI